MRKLRMFFCLIMVVSSISMTPVYINAASITVSDKSVESWYQDIEIKGVKPVISGAATSFQIQLNEHIDMQYNNFLKKTNVSTKKVIFSYKTVDSGNYSSILFYCAINDAVSSQNYIYTTVIDVENENILLINDVIGPNGVKLINKSFAENIAADPSKYIANFTGISEDHNFYLDGDTVYIPFGEFEISAGSVGIVEFGFQISKIKNYVIEKSDYKTKDVYGVKMVPLRQIVEEFGYSLIWNAEDKSIDILLNKTAVTSVKINTNSYTPPSGGAKRALESAPLLYDGKTYLPVSFFEEILSISYSIAPNGQITFSAYNK